jgi:hypothetical protein
MEIQEIRARIFEFDRVYSQKFLQYKYTNNSIILVTVDTKTNCFKTELI